MRVGVVVIGRNEARNLERTLQVVLRHHPALVYADSGSTDGSGAIAERLGVPVVLLGDGFPRSAARGRNAGRDYLRERFPELEYIQFVDGDTELEHDWVEHAARFLDENPDVGVVAGRLRERFRERNVYHRLADMEFDVPSGDTDAVGGIALYRASAFDNAGGFDPYLVSGEERELCRRIAASSMRVVRVPEAMAMHDINMEHFSQWWNRTKRTGYTSAEHFADRRIMGRKVLSNICWGVLLPGAAVGMALPTFGVSLLSLGAYAALWRRVRDAELRRGASAEDAALFASSIVVGKVPEAAGTLEFMTRRLRRGSARGPKR